MEAIPLQSDQLISELRKSFPRKAQGDLHSMDSTSIAYYSGQQSIIELLETRLEQEREDQLT